MREEIGVEELLYFEMVLETGTTLIFKAVVVCTVITHFDSL